MGGLCSAHGKENNSYRILVRKSEEKSYLEDLGIGGDNIKKDLKEMGR
jgi:hypothetical protein